VILWTVTQSLVEAFHAAFYSFPHRRPTLSAFPHPVRPRPVHSWWIVDQVWYSPDALHFVGYPGYWLLLGKPWHFPCRTNLVRKDSGCWCNLYLKIISPGSRTLDFTVVGRHDYRYAVKTYFKLGISLHGVPVVMPTNDREIPGSTPGRYKLQIKITSHPHACVYTCKCIHIHRRTYIHIRTYAHAHIHTYMRTHVHMHVYAYLYTDRTFQQRRFNASSNSIDTHTYPYTYAWALMIRMK